MAIKEGLRYNGKLDAVDGFSDHVSRTEELANHALVFIVRGIIEKWKQPVANPSRFAVLMGCVCVCEIRRRQSDSTGSFTYISNALSLETRRVEIGVGVRVGEVKHECQRTPYIHAFQQRSREHGHTLAWVTPHTAHDELAVSNFRTGYIVGKGVYGKITSWSRMTDSRRKL